MRWFGLRKRYDTESRWDWFHGHVLWCLGLRELTFWWQRRTRGFDDSEMWSLDHTILKFILPRLKHFVKAYEGIPCEVYYGEKTWEEVEALPEEERRLFDEEADLHWKITLQKMVRAIELKLDWNIILEAEGNEELLAEFEEGWELFHKYFFGLWN